MNRINKYRAWDKEGNNYSKWKPQMIYTDNWAKAVETKDSILNHCGKSNRFCFMQFTGLKDRHGIEIYEGDILKDNVGRIWVISYRENLATFIFLYRGKKDSWQSYMQFIKSQKPLEIIGNIYENPELLKVK